VKSCGISRTKLLPYRTDFISVTTESNALRVRVFPGSDLDPLIGFTETGSFIPQIALAVGKK
jgi:hypothetical protein